MTWRDRLPVNCYDGDGARALDARFIESAGISGYTLMRRAGQAAFRAIGAQWPAARSLVVVCGPGNNGGDGFVIGRAALIAGWQVRLVCLVRLERLKGDAAIAAADFQDAGGQIEGFDTAHTVMDADIVVDAVLGIGVNRDVDGTFAAAIEAINDARGRGHGVVAVDIPSGLDADRGVIHGIAVRADLTTTFIGLKLGLLTGNGPAVSGRIVFDDLGAPPDIAAAATPIAHRVDARRLQSLLAPRNAASYKNSNGHVLCVGGNRGMGGSIRMTAEAALRAGAGLVSVGCYPDHAAAMSQARPELMCAGIEYDHDLAPLVAAADVIALGPGLGQDEWGECLWRAAVSSDKPLIVDADGLNRLAREPRARGQWILTPHVGEAARLLDQSTAAVSADRPAAVRELARRYSATAVLKGAGSLIASDDVLDDVLQVNVTGNPGMAVAGMGDLLTGVIAGLCAQGLSLADAAALGVFVHGRAGDRAATDGGQRGLLPSDLFGAIRSGVNPAPC